MCVRVGYIDGKIVVELDAGDEKNPIIIEEADSDMKTAPERAEYELALAAEALLEEPLKEEGLKEGSLKEAALIEPKFEVSTKERPILAATNIEPCKEAQVELSGGNTGTHYYRVSVGGTSITFPITL